MREENRRAVSAGLPESEHTEATTLMYRNTSQGRGAAEVKGQVTGEESWAQVLGAGEQERERGAPTEAVPPLASQGGSGMP